MSRIVFSTTAGVARALMPDALTPEAVRGEVVTLLTDRSYRERAAGLAAEIAAMPAAEAVAAALRSS